VHTHSEFCEEDVVFWPQDNSADLVGKSGSGERLSPQADLLTNRPFFYNHPPEEVVATNSALRLPIIWRRGPLKATTLHGDHIYSAFGSPADQPNRAFRTQNPPKQNLSLNHLPD
jgi:hypothetical protein